MEDSTADRLLQLNREFYDTFAEAFTDSRAPTEPGFERILQRVHPGARVLDLGCGPGRLASLLPPGCSYTGVDSSAELLRAAAEFHATECDCAEPDSAASHSSDGANVGRAPADIRFVQADLARDPWPDKVRSDPVGDGYDWVILRAVLHHIPGFERRCGVLRSAAEMLGPKGMVVIANWQFLRIERLRRRLLPWDRIGLQESDVDPGDYLLDWQRNGYGVRYVHLIDEVETHRLAERAGLQIDDLFFADGHTNDLTLYAILHRPVVC